MTAIEFKFHGKYNKQLAGQYAYVHISNLEKRLKDDAAGARRTATLLQSTLDQFTSILQPEQVLSLKAAHSAMKSLSNDLELLKPWAEARRRHHDAEQTRENNARLDKIAGDRWLCLADMEAEAADLIEFYSQEERDAVEAWLCDLHSTNRAATPFVSSALIWSIGQALKSPQMDELSLKRQVANAINLMPVQGEMSRGIHGSSCWYGCLDDFVAWRHHRRHSRGLSAGAIALEAQ